MIRITATSSSADGGAPLLDLHRLVDSQCCTALSHLQHQVGIPNSSAVRVAAFATWKFGRPPKLLANHHFRVWHGSCWVMGKENFANGVNDGNAAEPGPPAPEVTHHPRRVRS